MEKITYAFIDGGYVRERLDAAMKEVFGVPGDLAPEAIAPDYAFKVYFYDCIDEVKRDSESEPQFEARRDAQKEMISRIRSRPGMHLSPGTLSRGRRRTQKEIDVLLTVEMLTHGFNKNMTHAIFVAGDLDFRPVVEALVGIGVFVNLWYEKRSIAEGLIDAADLGSELNWHALYGWNTAAFQAKHHPPAHSMEHAPVITAESARVGYSEGRSVEMLKSSAHGPFILRVERSDGVHWFEHRDREVLERYFSMSFSTSIQWKGQGPGVLI